ncbi:hypothetical protein JGE76_23605, partial [Salmonella enterica subsp. enterica serovar Rissen]|nr:hypothetical protein [Salmonella enterica subsp. enterica serovar Agona]MBJ4693216.1 hypothetical protein [Salmonella enterica subsp. enterica serovar Rissen]MBJ5309095.1 hypothetical protein [Salmonella enterica subsp. enterica serovar Agona]
AGATFVSATGGALLSQEGLYPEAFFLSMENPQLGWGFRKAFSFKPVIKTPFDLLKHLAVWQLQKFNKKSKGGPNGGRKELSAHPMEL